MRDNEFTRILDWPGYRVFRHEIDETAKTLRLWVRRKRGNRKLICSGCGRKFSEAYDSYQREVRDLPWRKYQTTVIIELYRVCCPQCGVRIEKVPQLPSKAPFSKDFEDAVGLAWHIPATSKNVRLMRTSFFAFCVGGTLGNWRESTGVRGVSQASSGQMHTDALRRLSPVP
jgi:transposase